MASIETQVISAVIRNKDAHTVLGEEPGLFASTGDILEFVRQYYMEYKDMPTKHIIEERFSDVEIPETEGPTEYFVNRLKQDFIKGHASSLFDFAQQALDGGESPAGVVDKAVGKLVELSRYTANSHDVNMTDYEGAIKYIEAEKMRAGDEGVPGIPTGFDSIDANYPTGLAAGNSITILGYSGKGKTFFSTLLGVRAWKSHRKVMVVSLEMPPEEYRARLYGMMAEGEFLISEIGNASVDTDHVREWGERVLENSPDFIVVGMDDSSDMTPNKIQAKIDMYQPDIVIIDYLQLMSDNRRTEGMTPRMLNLSREIKLMAMRNAIPIISISAVTDEENSKREAPPTLKQIAWSKGIEYDSNLAIAVHRYTGTNFVHIVCRKNRQGDEFSFLFEVDFDRGIWREVFEMPEQLKEMYA